MPTSSYRRPWADILAKTLGPLTGQQGSILIATVIAVTIVATLGTAIYSFVSTSGLTQMGSMSDTKAYYLAESGGHYAIKQLAAINASVDSDRHDAFVAVANDLSSAAYTVDSVGKFTLSGFSDATVGGFTEYRFTAKGLADLSTTREINYIVKVHSAAGVEIPFTGTGDTLDPNDWNVSGDAKLDNWDLKMKEDAPAADTQVSLDWDSSDTLPDLQEVWEGANGLLTYEVQVKVELGSDHDVLGGISFRLDTQDNADITDDTFYGLSFLWCKDHADLDDFCDSVSSKTFVVLWRQAADGTQTIIGKQLASSVSSSLVDGNKLASWATLVVRVQEQFNPGTGVRENLIYAFVGVPTTTHKGDIHWDYSKYTAVEWDELSFAGTDCSGGQRSCVADSTLTTANFSTLQDEIGLHAFGNDQVGMADLALRFNFKGSATSYPAGP